jgi:nucleoside-diphosphate-sugar epimerase
MRVLLTGASGFLGQILSTGLSADNEVTSLGRSSQNDIQVSLAKSLLNTEAANKSYDRVVHAAGLAHIHPKSKDEEKAFFDVNFLGTKNLCDWIDTWDIKPKIFVFISSVAVYGAASGLEIDEEHPLNGDTPYALSKMKAEEYLINWGQKCGIEILILRLPLIIGANAPGNLGKMVNGIGKGGYLSIGGGKARKSMVLADDVAQLINTEIKSFGIFNLTDGYHPTFSELETVIAKQLKTKPPRSIPLWFAKIIGFFGNWFNFIPINSDGIRKLSSDLTFSDGKAREFLGWNSSEVLKRWKI